MSTDPVPTVMIGIGGAGVGILKYTYKTLKKEEERTVGDADGPGSRPEDYFKFYAFDSNQDSLDELDELDITTTRIQDDKNFFDAAKLGHPYLTEEFEHSEEGARRTRPIGRYKFDNKSVPNFEDYMGDIDEIIENHMEYIRDFENPNRLNIFFVHSLAGGTGSGTFPLISGIISTLKDDMNQLDVYVGGIGVVSEMKHEALGEKSGFRPNTYAALSDVEKMSDDDIETLPVYSKAEPDMRIDERLDDPPETDLDIETPFDNYWFMGVNESLAESGKAGWQLESYMEEIDNTVAESVLSISRRKKEKENWAAANGVVGGLGEAEVAVPMDLIEEYCETLEDTQELEKPDEDSTYRIPRKRQLRHIDDRIDKIIDSTIQENFEDNPEEFLEEIYNGVDSLGANPEHIFDPEEDIESEVDDIYEAAETTCGIAKLNVRDIFIDETDDHRAEVEDDYIDTVNELAGKKEYDVSMQKGVGLIKKRASLKREIDQQIDYLEGAIEALDFGLIGLVIEYTKKAIAGSIILPPTRDHLENKLQEAREDRSELAQAHKLKANMEEMVEYIDEKHADTKEELKDDVRGLYEMKNRLDELKFILSRGSSSTRLGYLPVKRETIEDDLTSEWVENNINDIQECFDNGLVEREDFEDAVDRQIANSFPWEESSMQIDEIDGDHQGGETQTTWVFYHEDNEEITNDAVGEDADHETQKILRSDGEKLNYSANPFRVKIVSMYNISSVKRLELYQDLEDLSDNETLGQFASESPYDDWRQAFAYPEWYDDDIRRAFGVKQKITLMQPPELDWENDVDFSGLSQDQGDDTYIKKYGLYEYLWKGIHWERYDYDEDDEDDEDDWFEGWEETLEEETNVTKDELSDLGPTLETRRRWIKGTGDWEDILEEFVSDDEKGGMIEKKGIDVEWDLPEDQKTQTLD